MVELTDLEKKALERLVGAVGTLSQSFKIYDQNRIAEAFVAIGAELQNCVLFLNSIREINPAARGLLDVIAPQIPIPKEAIHKSEKSDYMG